MNIKYRQQVIDKLSIISLIAKKRILTVADRVKDNTKLISSRTQMRISLKEWLETKEQKHLNKIQKIITDAKKSILKLYAISVYDDQGKLVASTKDNMPNKSIDINFKKTPMISIHSDRKSDLIMASIDKLTLDNKSIGYVKIDFFADFLIDLIRDNEGLGNTGEWVIAVRDNNGDALFATPLKTDPDAAFIRKVSKDRTDTPIIQALSGNETIMSKALDYLGTPVLASTKYIEHFDLGLVVKIDEEEVNEVINNILKIFYYLGFIVIVIAVTFAIVIGYYIASPIEKLQIYAAEISKGNFAKKHIASYWSEVNNLSKCFNHMVHSLQDLRNNLEQKVQDRTKLLNESNKKLKKFALSDPLTGLYNRRYLSKWLEMEVNRFYRNQTNLALAILDIDFFKRVNDTWGHHAGDLVLKKISSYLQKSLRKTDIIVRLGGEEFCIVISAYAEKQLVLTFLDRLRMDISRLKFKVDQEEFNVTCSFGIAYMSNNITNYNELIKQADLALYEAKKSGRNCIKSYD